MASAKHGELRELFDEVWFVTGEVRMGGPLPMAFSRNMTVVREGDALTLIGSMRLDDEGLRELEELGTVAHVIRLAAFHGMDDAFYRERYGATIWAVEGSAYRKGFDTDGEPYLEPDEWLTEDGALPIEGARLIRFGSATPPEGMLLLERDGGILISGDCLQHIEKADEYFTLPARLVMWVMGFMKPHNVGPGWVRGAKPDPDDVRRLLDLEFEHVLPVHGAPVRGDAKAKYRPALERLR